MEAGDVEVGLPISCPYASTSDKFRLVSGELSQPKCEGVSELRVDYGPGCRIYFVQRADRYVLLLAGGDKSSQAAEIRKAQLLAREL